MGVTAVWAFTCCGFRECKCPRAGPQGTRNEQRCDLTTLRIRVRVTEKDPLSFVLTAVGLLGSE